MKLLVISDTHLGHPGWGTFGQDVFAQAHALAQKHVIDVVLHNGDIVEPSTPGASLQGGLERLQKIPARVHLWVVGNNDIEFLPSMLDYPNYVEPLRRVAESAGVHLLDASPKVVEDVTFVGNFGFFDLSLWRVPNLPVAEFPKTKAQLEEDADKFHRPNIGTTVAEMFQICQGTLHRHLRSVGTPKVVVSTHTVPSPEMVIYGHTPRYDFLNAWMGWDDSKQPHPIQDVPGLVLQLCGHTHRGMTLQKRCPLVNVSGREQPHLFEV